MKVFFLSKVEILFYCKRQRTIRFGMVQYKNVKKNFIFS